MRKRVHKHGGSKAVDLPIHFIKKLPTDYVTITEKDECLMICPEDEFDSLESDPLFAAFVQGMLADAMKHPDQLVDIRDVWGEEWDTLLEGVEDEDELSS